MSFSIGAMVSLPSSSPTNTLTFITYLNYLSVRVLAQNIWYLKLGNLGGVIEGISVEGCVEEPTDRCYDFHQGNKYPNLRLLPFDFFPVSHWPDPTGSQRSTTCQPPGHEQLEVGDGCIWMSKGRMSSTTALSVSCSRNPAQQRCTYKALSSLEPPGPSTSSPTVLNQGPVLHSRHRTASLPKHHPLNPYAHSVLPPLPGPPSPHFLLESLYPSFQVRLKYLF